MSFRKIDVSDLSFNPFKKIGEEWMLLTGGSSKNNYNGFMGTARCYLEYERPHKLHQT